VPTDVPPTHGKVVLLQNRKNLPDTVMSTNLQIVNRKDKQEVNVLTNFQTPPAKGNLKKLIWEYHEASSH
jgi:hypothetical protein